MKKFFITAIICLLALQGAQAQRLVILHTNDTHSQIEPIRFGRNDDRGGVHRRLQFINEARTKYGKNKVLLLDAGDYNQGTPYFTVAKGDLELELMNALGYDVVAMGNHELDNGQDELLRRLSMANYPTLCCNYDFSNTVLKVVIKPYTIVKRGGLKIGIIGVTTNLKASVSVTALDSLIRLNTIEEINKHAAYLKNEQKCDLVILLSHLGFDGGNYDVPSDDVAAAESSDLDIIIGGHSHTFIEEPLYVKNKNGKDVIIVTAGEKGIEVGELKIF